MLSQSPFIDKTQLKNINELHVRWSDAAIETTAPSCDTWFYGDVQLRQQRPAVTPNSMEHHCCDTPKTGPGFPPPPQNSAEPLGFCSKVLWKVSHSKGQLSLLKRTAAEPQSQRFWKKSKEGYWGRCKRGRRKRRNSCAIVTQQFSYGQLLRNYCAIVVPQNPRNEGEVPGNQLLLRTIALPFVSYCVTIAQLLRLFPGPSYSDPKTPPIILGASPIFWNFTDSDLAKSRTPGLTN